MQAKRNRRSHGTGSLRQIGEKWYGQWRPVAGGPLVKKVIGPVRKSASRDGLTRAMAEARLREMMSQPSEPLTERVTIEDAGQAHLAHLRLKGRKKATIEGYQSQLRIHLIPYFQSKPLSRITASDVERLIQTKLDAGLTPKTVRNIIKHLHGVFELVIRKQWAASNPCRLVDHPGDPAGDAEVRFLSEVELEKVISAAGDHGRHKAETLARAEKVRQLRDDRHQEWKAIGQVMGCSAANATYLYRCQEVPSVHADLRRVDRGLYLTAAMTGLRQGELLGLRWSSVDFDSQKIRVRGSYVRGEFGAAKSKRSVRAVPMADRVATELKTLYLASAYNADDDLVFGHPQSGQPLDRSNVTRRFKSTLKRAGVREVRFHDLRHTFGTRMAATGVPMRTLQEWMGHRDIKTTLIYADYSPNEHEVSLVNAAFSRAA